MTIERRIQQISARKLTVLLLLAAPDAHGKERASIAGTTRMQKLVFLAKQQSMAFLANDQTFRFDFAFDADRFGPADLELYQDIELLKLTGWISVAGEAPSTPMPFHPNVHVTFDSLLGDQMTGQRLRPEEAEETELSFDYLMGEQTEEVGYAEVEEEQERVYSITDKGYEGLDQIRLSTGNHGKFDKLAQVCREVKRQYGSWPLSTLVKHVYKTYPDTAVRSEIRGRVLGY